MIVSKPLYVKIFIENLEIVSTYDQKPIFRLRFEDTITKIGLQERGQIFNLSLQV